MADTETTHYAFVLPEVGASADTWGTKNNANWSGVDTALRAVSLVASGAATAAAGKQNQDATLTALAGVYTVANRLIYATGTDTFATTAFTVFGRSLVGAADEAAARAALGLGDAALKTTGTASGNVPVLDGSGKLSTAILPGLSISSTTVVGSQAAMLALPAQEGDVAVRTDVSKSFILSSNSPSTLADWIELLSPPNAVSSVAGRTGTIVLNSADVGLSNVENKSGANIRSEMTKAEVDAAVGKRVARVNSGSDASSGLISWGTAAPVSLAEGEIYFQYDA